MTRRDIFLQIAEEATGKPKKLIQSFLQKGETFFGTATSLDVELSDIEAEKLLTTLRSELPGIRNWFIQAGLDARLGNN